MASPRRERSITTKQHADDSPSRSDSPPPIRRASTTASILSPIRSVPKKEPHENKEEKKPSTKQDNEELEPNDDGDEPLPAKKKKKRRKKTTIDRAWTKRSEKSKNNNVSNPEAMLRIWRGVPAIDQETKSAFTVDKSVVANLSPAEIEKFERSLADRAKTIPTFSPLKKIIERSDRGTPRIGETGSGRILKRDVSLGPIRFFRENPSPGAATATSVATTTLIESVDAAKAERIRKEEAFKIVKEPDDEAHNGFNKTITEKSVRAAAAKIRKNEGRRCQSQNQVMAKEPKDANKVSATKYAAVFGDFGPCEWAHYVEHKLIADDGQDPRNMGCATKAANTHMLSVELNHGKLVKAFRTGYQIKCLPDYVKGLNNKMLTHLKQDIIAGPFTFPFVFNCQGRTGPALTDHKYVGAMFDAAIEATQPDADAKKDTITKKTDTSGLYLLHTPPRTPKRKDDSDSTVNAPAEMISSPKKARI